MTKKKIFTIAGIAVGAVIVIGIVIWLIFFRGGSVAPSDPNEMVYVTSVADITGTGSLGMTAKYSGVVEPEKTLSVQKDDTKKIAELYVTVGQEVKVGDKLFSYDTDDLQMQLEEAQLQLESLKNRISTLNQQIDSLQKEKNKASSDEQLSYTLQIQSAQLEVKSTEYDQSTKAKEIENLKKMGVHFTTDCIVGKTITVDQLESDGYKGIFVGSGAGLPNFMNITGENAINIMSSNEYLTRVNLMDAANPLADTPMNLGKKVVVVGGGNTAMDSCRTAKRLGAEVTLIYRRSEAEMPARLEEVKHAKEEGINFLTLHNPKEYLADENGAVKAAVLDVMQLGEPDASGRRSPVATGNTITIDCDQVIVAVGVSPNPLVPNSIQGLQLGRKNTISVDEAMKSSCDSIYAGGDIVRGGATVILAMGDGRRAALNMDEALKK